MEDNSIMDFNIEDIKHLIYTIKGKQVMLDFDVARLYKVETKKLNQAVRRNIERFPERFCFQLTEDEVKMNWSQIVTSSPKDKNKHRGKSYLPFAFSEQGIAMLSGLLRSEIAVQTSINIMDAFVEMRRFLVENSQVLQKISNMEHKLLEHDDKINYVFDELQKNKTEDFRQKIFFKGQIWDSYELLMDIIKKAKSKIVIIDNYIDDTILKMLQKKNKNVEVVVITSANCTITQLDLKKFNEQYPTLKIAITDKFHDRFIIVDSKELYHCGASLKDVGKKCFAISMIDDEGVLRSLNENI